MTKKANNPKLYQNGAMEVADVKKVHTMLMLLLKQFNVKPKVMPIVTLAKASNDSPQSLLKGDAETLVTGEQVIIPKIRISPSITDNARAVANALAHNVVHLAMPSPFIKGTKHNDDFKKKADELGLNCEKKQDDPSRNHLWTEVSLTDEQYNTLVQTMGGEVSFNFVAIEKNEPTKKVANQKHYYAHPDGMRWVESTDGDLKLFAEFNGEIRPMVKLEGDAEQVKSRLREMKARRKEFDEAQNNFVGLVG